MNSNAQFHTEWQSHPPSPPPPLFTTYSNRFTKKESSLVHLFVPSIFQESEEKWGKLFFYGLQDIILSIYWNIEGLDVKLSFLLSFSLSLLRKWLLLLLFLSFTSLPHALMTMKEGIHLAFVFVHGKSSKTSIETSLRYQFIRSLLKTTEWLPWQLTMLSFCILLTVCVNVTKTKNAHCIARLILCIDH